jgi:hypothetical protein
MAQTTFRLESTYHYARYIHSFYPPATEDIMMRYRGNITSLVRHSRASEEGVWEFYDADIARVVQLVARSPNVYFQFELHKDLRRYALNDPIAQLNSMLAVFAISPDPKWRDMAKAIKEMRFRFQFYDSKLRITMSEDMARKWKSTVFELWDSVTQPARGIRELRLAYANPNPDSRPYDYRYVFWFDDAEDKTISWSWG